MLGGYRLEHARNSCCAKNGGIHQLCGAGGVTVPSLEWECGDPHQGLEWKSCYPALSLEVDVSPETIHVRTPVFHFFVFVFYYY